MVEENGAKLSVLVFNVVLHSCLARPAQLVHLLQVVLIGFNFLIVVLLWTSQHCMKSHEVTAAYELKAEL